MYIRQDSSPCDEADLAKSDLTDTDLTDHFGAPRTKYWCYDATVAHEEKHRSDWEDCYTAPLTIATALASSISVEIDCSNPNTQHCNTVKAAQISVIDGYFDEGWEEAWELFDDPSTTVLEYEVRAYVVSASIEYMIALLLPGECSP